jgi:glutamate--cysteine ligase
LSLQDHLALLDNPQFSNLLKGIVRGIEKESLRVTPSGHIASTPHPQNLGSALTHPSITTDYSEALLEFITAPSCSIEAVLKELEDLHRFTYRQIGDELLWVSSMPCQLGADDQIPIAQYGSSNIGQMKEIYRKGLGHRYGRAMQTIAGIHYNFSLPDELWVALKEKQQSHLSLQDFKSEGYFKLIRNFRRYAWLLLYLLGSAPAVCRSFVASRDHHLSPVGNDSHSLYQPNATSLRMGDLGYQSKAQSNLDISYNSLEQYIKTLRAALAEPYQQYADIGLKNEQGEYNQLNTHVLQIENEFYSPIRPKRTAAANETPLQALERHGVEYIEVRCLDVNPLLTCGIDAQTIRFLDTFLLFCLFSNSPDINDQDSQRLSENMLRTVYSGRDPELKLWQQQTEKPLRQWAEELLATMVPIAQKLDYANQCEAEHSQALYAMQGKVKCANFTPSAKMLEEMQNNNETYFRMAMRKAKEQRTEFTQGKIEAELEKTYSELAKTSHNKQAQIENTDTQSFDRYLADYWTMSKTTIQGPV